MISSYFQPYKICSVKCDQNVLCLCFCFSEKNVFDKFSLKSFVFHPSNLPFKLFSVLSLACGVVSFLVISNVQFSLPSNKCALQCVNVKFGERTIVLKKFSSGRLARFSSSEYDDQQCQKSNNLGFPFCFTLFVWKVYKSVAVFPPTHCGGNTDRPKKTP